MLDLREIRQDPERVRAALARRGEEAALDEVLRLDARRRELLRRVEEGRAQKNRVSEEIGRRRRQGEDVAADVAAMKELSAALARDEAELKDVEAALEARLAELPNLPHPEVPDGGEEGAREVRRWGRPRAFPFPPRPHWEIGVNLGLLDFERAAKVSGARFAFYRGWGAALERALIAFMLDVHVREHGYEELYPPYLVRESSLFGTGQLPRLREDMFAASHDLFLIPTAEVPLTNFHQGEILAAADLPRRYCAYSACFRAEAGAAGRDTRGLIRQHQFDKVELVKLTRPEDSYRELQSLVADAEDILQRLELPYRVVQLAAGDLGFASAMTYDLEVWFPSQGTYREVSSCSNLEAFQARRAGIRFRPEEGAKPEYVHTLNGSGLAVGRTFAAILENFQEEDGSVTIPSALRPYLHGRSRLTPP